jgi:protein phosphatase
LDDRLFVAQVGDSRAYLLREGQLVQVSRDQSLVNQLIEAGQLTEEEAETFEHNNIILQALGTSETVQVDLTYADLRRGDVLLLCSDGLSGMIRADEMKEVLLTVTDPLEACKVLTERANMAGGHDNITVIVAHFDGDRLAEVQSSDEALKYRKYALPEVSPEATVRSLPLNPQEMATPPPSEEARRESRRLKVGHTMVGLTNPLAGVELGQQPAAVAGALPPSPTYSADDDPVQIPTTGLSPGLVGAMVVGAMLLVAVTGYLVLR